MRSSKGKESSESADAKSESVEGKSESVEGKSEDVHARQVPHRNMEEAVLGPYSSARGGCGIDDFGFHLQSALTIRSDLKAQEAAFMATQNVYDKYTSVWIYIYMHVCACVCVYICTRAHMHMYACGF